MLLDGAQAAISRRRSVSAQVRQQVELFGHRMVGSGSYVETLSQGQRLTRLELRTQLGDQTTSLVQVCDGLSIWTHRRLLDDGKLERVDLGRVREALRRAGRAGEGIPPDAVARLCGISRLLGGLQRSFQFDDPQPGLWGPEERPVWRLTGRWKPERLAATTPGQEPVPAEVRPIDPAELPPQLPDRIVLLLGQADLFPYRVEYHRFRSPQGRFLVTMDLYDVVFDAPVDPGRFAYAAGDRGEIDATASALKSLGLPTQ